MYHLLEKNVEDLEKEELGELISEIDKTKEDNPLLEKLSNLLKQYDSGQVKKHELRTLNHTIRTVLTVLKKNKEEELREILKFEQEEVEREKEIDESIECPHCGTINDRSTRYCKKCGREIFNLMDKVCVRCNAVNHHSATFCMSCGERFDTVEEAKLLNGNIECPFCGKKAKGGMTAKSVSIRCPNCGADWGGSKEQYGQLLKNL
jgi:DNA-directed RNA polymerase subunit RPC12/RpoP